MSASYYYQIENKNDGFMESGDSSMKYKEHAYYAQLFR